MMPSIVILFCFPLDAVRKQKTDKILRTEMLKYENARWEICAYGKLMMNNMVEEIWNNMKFKNGPCETEL